MITALALAAVLSQVPPARSHADDVYCAALGVLMAEAVQKQPTPDLDAEASIYTLMLYFLGRVEGARPADDTSKVVLDRAEGLTLLTVPPADLVACAAVLQTRGERLVGRATERGRSFH